MCLSLGVFISTKPLVSGGVSVYPPSLDKCLFYWDLDKLGRNVSFSTNEEDSWRSVSSCVRTLCLTSLNLLIQLELNRTECFKDSEICQLTLKTHISEISLKIAKNIGVIHRIARLLPQSIKLSLYYALVYPYLSYCNLIWAINYPSRLTRLQKRIIRLIAGVRKWEHSSPYLLNLKS